MDTAKTILQTRFGGNVSKAARETGISRESWHTWKRLDPQELPGKLAVWILKQQSKDAPSREG
jgi:hypothetical protein